MTKVQRDRFGPAAVVWVGVCGEVSTLGRRPKKLNVAIPFAAVQEH